MPARSVSLRCCRNGPLRHATGTTCVVLSGGNVDLGLLPGLIRRHETQAGRRLILFARISDRPGGLARLLTLFAEHGANLVEVEHVREGVDLHVRETGVQVVLEVRGRGHAESVVRAATDAGYAIEVIEQVTARDQRGDEDVLQLGVVVEHVHRVLATEAALLEPAERRAVADRAVGVDADRAGFHRPHDAQRLRAVAASTPSPTARSRCRCRCGSRRPRRRTAARPRPDRTPRRDRRDAVGSDGVAIMIGCQ